MTIAVTTPTGRVGSRVVQLLVQAGVRPRLLVRDPTRLADGVREFADTRQGDLDDAIFVTAATTDVRALFVVDPTPHVVADPVRESAAFGARVADAVRHNGIERVVFLSSGGAERRHGVGHIDGLARIEEALDDTGVAVVHLRAGYFYTNLPSDTVTRGVLSTSADPDEEFPWVDPRDIGDIVAARLLSEAWNGRAAQGVHGPADLSFRQVGAILSDLSGRSIEVAALTDDEVRTSLSDAGLPAGAVEGIVGMTAGTRGRPPEQARGFITTTPTTFRAWASEFVQI